MESAIFLRYFGTVQENDSEIPLSELGKSLIGFEKLVQDFSEILCLEGDISVTAVPSREGSHIVDMILHFDPVSSIPFDSPEALLAFLKLTGQQYSREAFEFIQDSRDFLNKYFAEYPFDVAFLSAAIIQVLRWAKKLKKNQNISDDELPKRVEVELRRLLKKRRFKDLVSPIINEAVSSIEVSQSRDFRKNTTKIDQGNFENLLPEESQILPDFMEGDVKTLQGEITSLKGTRGDSFTFKTEIDSDIYNLELFPPPPSTTKNFVMFYKEFVEIEVSIERTSMFKKPKLHMKIIEKIQKELKFDEED